MFIPLFTEFYISRGGSLEYVKAIKSMRGGATEEPMNNSEPEEKQPHDLLHRHYPGTKSPPFLKMDGWKMIWLPFGNAYFLEGFCC